jgi:hypothetical protein
MIPPKAHVNARLSPPILIAALVDAGGRSGSKKTAPPSLRTVLKKETFSSCLQIIGHLYPTEISMLSVFDPLLDTEQDLVALWPGEIRLIGAIMLVDDF